MTTPASGLSIPRREPAPPAGKRPDVPEVETDQLAGENPLAQEFFNPKRTDGVDETLAEFARRRLGAEALDKLIAPMVSGIFAGNPETMSLKSCFPRIHELEQQYGGLLKAMVKLAKQKKAEAKAGKQVASAAGPGGVLTSFVGGIQELTDGTAKACKATVQVQPAVPA